MVRPSFSTVACPEWTLDRVASAAAEYGYDAVELRTFGDRSTLLACDPALSAEEKTRTLFGAVGVELASLATSVRFDERVKPPVLGRVIGDTERAVRAARRAVDLAVALECPLVRVFAFEIPPREKRASALARILERLAKVLDHAANTGARIALENGGSFPTGADVMELIRQSGSPLLGASYSMACAAGAGETPERGVEALGDRLWLARIKDLKGRVPCALGEGELPCREFVRALAGVRFSGPLVYEWDRLWIPKLEPAETVLPAAARTIFRWIAEAEGDAAGRVMTAGRGAGAGLGR